MGETILKLKNICKGFGSSGNGYRKVLEDISFEMQTGQIIGVAGPSGSGKSTLARIILGIEIPDRGTVFFRGKDLYHQLGRSKRRKHFRNVQMIWQDPYVYLNPYQRVLTTISEPLHAFNIGTRQWRRQRVFECLEMVGLSSSLAPCLPRQLSGGQCQRVAMARALSVAPSLLICDEVLVNLDLPQQVAIIKLLKTLQEDLHLTILFISHDHDALNRLCSGIIRLPRS